MGNEATVRAKVEGKADEGQVLLEMSEIIFRGARRCVIRIEDIRADATVSGGWLKLGNQLELELGAELAAKWLDKIKNPRSVLQKLGLKPRQRIKLINVADPSFAEELVKSGAVISSKDPVVTFLQIRDASDLKLIPKLKGDEVLWLLRPKGKNAPVGERETMAAGKAAGLVDIKVVGFSETLSAEKYVVPLAARNRK